MPRQYLPQPDGRVCDEGLGEESWTVVTIPYRVGATSREELGNPIYPPARRKLTEHGISCGGHAARELTKSDYNAFDLLIGMDSANLRNMHRICGGDPDGRIHLLLDYTDHPRDVADPWYTDDFEATWRDVLAGCQGLLKELSQKRGEQDGTK